jgi:hypothetical protein
MADEVTTPRPGSPRFEAKALEVAQKVEAMANKAVDDLIRHMRTMGWTPEFRAIVLEQVARKAMAVSIAAQKEAGGAR